MAETIIRTKDYRSDIVLTMHMTLGGETVNVPQHDFVLRFFTENNARHYDCGRIKGEWLHCAPDASDATLLTCYIKNHGLGCGMLQCTYIDLSPNDGMEDGVQRTFSVSGLDLELVDDASDDTQAVDGTVTIDINAVLADLHDAAEAAIASQQKNIASIVYLASDQPGGQNTITITLNDGTVISGTVLNGKGADDDYVKDVKLNGRSVVTNNGVALIVTEASQLPALVTIDGMRKENVLDALVALNQYISSVEESIDEHGGETELVFGSLNNGIFYDINGNEAVRSTTLLYIDRSTGIIYRWGANSFEQVGGKDLGEYSLKNVPFLENPDTSNPDVFNIYKTYEDYVAWLRDHSASRLMTVAELLAYLDANIGQYVLALDAASSPEYVQRLSAAGGIATQSSATTYIELRSHDNSPGLKISFSIDRTATNTGTTLTAERSTGITIASYNGNTKVNEVSIDPAGVLTKLANGTTTTYNLPSSSGKLALQSEVAGKQDALVSGQNIKTVNGNSVLGAGNLELGELFVVTMTQNNSVYTADKSVSEIYAASYTNGKPVIAVMRDINNPVLILTDCDPDADSYVFSAIESNVVTTLRWQQTDDYTYELETIALQSHLVSGTNIKTINNESLLGSGNVTVKPSDLTFTITQSGTTYTADKTFAEIQAAIRSGATVMGAFDYGGYMVLLSLVGQSVDSIIFAALNGSQVIAFLISASAVTRADKNLIDSDELAAVTGVRVVANWTTTAMIGSMYSVTGYDLDALVIAYNANRYIQLTFNGGEWGGVTCFCGGYYIDGSDKVFIFTAWQSANLLFVELYPSGVVSVTALNVAAKADKTLATTDIPATGLLPNVVYNYGTTDTVSVTLAAGEAGMANIWCFVFTAQTAACTVTLPSGVVLGNEYAWDMVAGRRYEVSIMDNVAIVNYSD